MHRPQARRDGRPIAPHGAVTLADLEAEGIGPAQVRSRLAVIIGLAEPGEPGPLAQLEQRFDPSTLPLDPWVAADG